METIHHIKTGGTIGGCVPEFREIELLANIFPDMVNLDKYLLESLKVHAKYEETVICHKDSRAITEDDRIAVSKTIENEFAKGTKKFLITHGTYTMPDTGIYLSEHLSEKVRNEAMVLITGSMFPWTVLGSDAPLNLGAALGVLLNFDKPQISICMHARLFDPYKVTKDASNLIFVDK